MDARSGYFRDINPSALKKMGDMKIKFNQTLQKSRQMSEAVFSFWQQAPAYEKNDQKFCDLYILFTHTMYYLAFCLTPNQLIY